MKWPVFKVQLLSNNVKYQHITFFCFGIKIHCDRPIVHPYFKITRLSDGLRFWFTFCLNKSVTSPDTSNLRVALNIPWLHQHSNLQGQKTWWSPWHQLAWHFSPVGETVNMLDEMTSHWWALKVQFLTLLPLNIFPYLTITIFPVTFIPISFSNWKKSSVCP